MEQARSRPLRDAAAAHDALDLTAGPPPARGARFAKRSLDVAIAGLAIVVLAPLLAIVAMLVALTSPGPVLFRQTRVGYRGTPFTILKFRTMVRDNDDGEHRDFVAQQLRRTTAALEPSGRVFDDSRITALGAWLRRTSVDELPQLLNVLWGQMSMVGPRPCLPWEVPLFEPGDLRRFDVKPGLTGLWQVSGRNDVSMRDALDLDVDYVQRRSTRLDLWILARTIPAVLRCRGAR